MACSLLGRGRHYFLSEIRGRACLAVAASPARRVFRARNLAAEANHSASALAPLAPSRIA